MLRNKQHKVKQNEHKNVQHKNRKPLKRRNNGSSTRSNRFVHTNVTTPEEEQYLRNSWQSALKEIPGLTAVPQPPTMKPASSRPMYDVDQLVEQIAAGDRRALAKGITLIESINEQHQILASDLLNKILLRRATAGSNFSRRRNDPELYRKDQEYIAKHQPELLTLEQIEAQNLAYGPLKHRHGPLPPELKINDGKPKGAIRVGISGTPGVGKSTTLETFGMHLIEKYGLKVACLTIDPSSTLTGGSLLGDKTRMKRLSLHDHAYIRPSPSKGLLGGVGFATNEAAQLLEWAGYDVIFIESVGVGQSEHTITQVCDILLMLMNPSGGDSLQGMKKGLLEYVDLICVTKCDGDLAAAAQRTKRDYAHAMEMYTTRSHSYGWMPKVLLSSVIEDVERFYDNLWGHILKKEHVLSQPITDLHPDAIDSLGLHMVMEAYQSNNNNNDINNNNSSNIYNPAKNPTLLDVRRAAHRIEWMRTSIDQMLSTKFRNFIKNDKSAIPNIERNLIYDHSTPRFAAKEAFDAYIEHEVQQRMNQQHPKL